MKKSLFLLAAMLLSLQPGHATALFTNPAGNYERESVTCNAGTLTGEHGALYSRHSIYNISHFRKAKAATTAVAMTVDLSAAAKVTEPTKLLTFSSDHELGLMATPEGITGNWHGQTWGETVPYGKLANLPSALSRNGSAYFTFTVVASGCCGSGWNGIGGIMGYDTNGGLIINLPLLASAENKDYSSITANLDLVKIISVDPKVSTNPAEVASDAAAQARKAEYKFLKARGEWLSPSEWVFTCIGFLVLLGGVSITCFRKGNWT